MSNVAIKVEDLGKRYIIKHETQERYKTFQDILLNGSNKFIRSLNPFKKDNHFNESIFEEFWALDNINFEVKKGEKIGIIGRNGAGKSTLLKILSRITEPTKGKIHINGRIASLLEVGTGFHPELTGRENIYLNGAILGMSRGEIASKFDEIVEFSEVEKFLDTPVKRYSSGMYVRLAFSVAAHLESEILVVDEVLAVGDIEFQKKCLGMMGDVSKEGRTILFVSHNMQTIQNLCDQGLFLNDGQIESEGNIDSVLNTYMEQSFCQISDLKLVKRNGDFGSRVKFTACELFNSKMEKNISYRFGEIFFVEIECIGNETVDELQFVVGINNSYDQRISTIISYGGNNALSIHPGDTIKARLKVDLCLNPGEYNITISLRNEIQGYDQIKNVRSFSVDNLRENYLIKDAHVPFGLVHMSNPEWDIKKY